MEKSMEKDLFFAERPMYKIHKSFQAQLEELDNTLFGGFYYSDSAKKLHIIALQNSNLDLSKFEAKDVIFHKAKFSYGSLLELQTAVDSLIGSNGIHASSCEPDTNLVRIGVDKVSEELLHFIHNELSHLGYNDESMYVIEQIERPTPMSGDTQPIVEDNTNENVQLSPNYSATIMPGGMMVRKDSNGNYGGLASINFGFLYNGKPYLVGAGHACPTSYANNDVYYVPYSGNGYPIAGLTASYNSSNRVKIGKIALRNVSGSLDLFTVRITENNLAFTHTAYNGWTIDRIGGNVAVGDLIRVCGVTTRYDADYEYGTCSAINQTRTVSGTTISNMFKMNFGANNGTSGGPVITRDSDNGIRLVGAASSNDTSSFYAVMTKKMLESYSLTMLPAGAISV